MKAKATFLILFMIAGVATIFTGNLIIKWYKSTGALMLVRDYTAPYMVSALIYIVLAIILACCVCNKYNWK
jgi:hypothetical protein